ncbi:MAG: PQQ-like beta-propeller repeat protein [Marinilabiliaceae bacterium]|nr:PQQ-like beta-propeller repeat protein [Marinilabiliaceae bacterium]
MKLFFGTLVFLLSFSIYAQKTIQWRGTDRSGVYDETTLLKSWGQDGPKLLWHYDGLGEGHSSVAIDANKIYVTGLIGKTGYLFVFDINGKILNKIEYGNEWDKNYNGPRSTVTINEGKLYIATGTGDLICLDQNSFNLIWKKNIQTDFGAKNIKWGINESPLIVNEKIIFTPGGKTNNVVALNKNDGSLIWASSGEGGSAAYCSPIYANDLQIPQIITMTEDHILGIDIATGKKLWSHENKNRYSVHANTPIYSNGMVLCTSGYGKGSVMLKLTNGGKTVEKVWEQKLLDTRIGAMVKIGDHIYGSGDFSKFWFCADWKTGNILYQDKSLPTGVTIAADGMLFCYSDKGDMALVNISPQKFDMISKFKITMGTEQHWAHPVINNGILYVRHGNTLMAYKVK